MAVTIIGVAVVTLVAALGTAFRTATLSRVDANGDVLLVRYAEALAAVPYEACSTAGAPSQSAPYQSAGVAAVPSIGLPPGISAGSWGSGDGTARSFELTIENTTYWNGDTAPATFDATCPAGDHGSEMLHLRVRSGDGAYDRRLSIFKRAS